VTLTALLDQPLKLEAFTDSPDPPDRRLVTARQMRQSNDPFSGACATQDFILQTCYSLRQIDVALK
jgi:hypothetical protein